MKKIKNVLAALLALVMMLSVQLTVFAQDDETPVVVPKLTFSSFTVNKSGIKPGDVFTLTATVSNPKASNIEDASFKFSGGDAFSVYMGSDTEYVQSFSSYATVSKTFICNNDTNAGSHPISVSCNYTYRGCDGSAEANYSVMTVTGSNASGNTPVLVMSYDKPVEKIKSGDKFDFDFYIANKSAQYDVKNVNIKINGGDSFTIVKGSDTVYKNFIAKNSTAEFSKRLMCNKSVSSGYHPVSLSVSYEYIKSGSTEQGTAEATFSVKTEAKKSSSSISFTPRLVIGGFSYGGKSIKGGKDFNLSFSVKNNSKNIKAKNVIIKVSGGETFVVADGTDTISIDNINPNSSVSVSKKFNCLSTAQSGVYPITASISYEYIEGGQKQSGSDDLTMSIPVVQPDKVMFTGVDLANKTVTIGEETDCGFKIVNTGKTVLNNGTVSVYDETGTELNSAYIGSIEAGSQYQSNYNLPITLNEAGDVKLTLVFEYENDNTEKKKIKQSFKVTAQEYVDPFPTEQEQPVEEDTGDTSGSKKKVIIGVACGGALAVIIAAIATAKKKKHKKGKVDFNEEI